ncbi:MAG: zf-HC2 domain-containing protein [Nitrospirae bacterium]|nr:zf-HC2 domain-containing protein [Nitrospirota bacterium]
MDPLCKEIQEQFVDYIDRSLPFTERERVQGHLLTCNGCSRALDMTRQLINLCSQVGEEPVPAGFSARLSDRLQEISLATIPTETIKGSTGQRRHQRIRQKIRQRIRQRIRWTHRVFPVLQPGRIWAIAGLALLLLLIPFYYYATKTEQSGNPATIATYRADMVPAHVGLNEDTLIRIWFDAREPVEQVRFYLELPEGIAMVQDGQVVAERRLQWEGNLQSGRNLIPLTVRGVARGQWRVIVLIEKGLARKERSVDIKVNGI